MNSAKHSTAYHMRVLVNNLFKSRQFFTGKCGCRRYRSESTLSPSFSLSLGRPESRKCKMSYRSVSVHHFHSNSKSFQPATVKSSEVLKIDDILSNRPTEGPTSDSIESCIIYDKDGIVAVNKPQNLSVYGKTEDVTDELCSLKQMMSVKKQDASDTYLEVGLSLKSFYSGIVLFCTNKESKAKVSKLVSGAAAQKFPFMSYLAITVGVPQVLHNQVQETYITQEYLHGREMGVVSEEVSQAARKAGTAMSVSYKISPLLVNEETGAALVEVSVNKDRWTAIEVLLSHYLSPVLGDHIYSSRTYRILGVPFPASPVAAQPGPQQLPTEIQEAIFKDTNVTDQDAISRLPLFVHRHKVTLNKFHRDASSLTLTAPPPSQFLTMLRCLGLYDEDLLHRFYNMNNTVNET